MSGDGVDAVGPERRGDVGAERSGVGERGGGAAGGVTGISRAEAAMGQRGLNQK